MLIQQRLSETQYNIRIDPIHNALVITVMEDFFLGPGEHGEILKDLILVIDTDGESKAERWLDDYEQENQKESRNVR